MLKPRHSRKRIPRTLNWWRNIERSWELTAAFDGAAVTVPALHIVGDRDMLVAVFQQAICRYTFALQKLWHCAQARA
jgi:hypothetical protein